MKRLSTGLLAALVAVGIGMTSAWTSSSAMLGDIEPYADLQIAQVPPAAPPADFGTPPSGEVPILFNDRHVYSKPDRLKANRVLAALVRGNTILIPCSIVEHIRCAPSIARYMRGSAAHHPIVRRNTSLGEQAMATEPRSSDQPWRVAYA